MKSMTFNGVSVLIGVILALFCNTGAGLTCYTCTTLTPRGYSCYGQRYDTSPSDRKDGCAVCTSRSYFSTNLNKTVYSKDCRETLYTTNTNDGCLTYTEQPSQRLMNLCVCRTGDLCNYYYQSQDDGVGEPMGTTTTVNPNTASNTTTIASNTASNTASTIASNTTTTATSAATTKTCTGFLSLGLLVNMLLN